MRIERLQVEEGFLDQLDVPFVPGLNVLIGARGTGKTSCIELIRFCLGAPAFTDDAGHRGEQQALSVLGGGRVTVTFSVDGTRYSLSRTATDPPPAFPGGTRLFSPRARSRRWERIPRGECT